MRLTNPFLVFLLMLVLNSSLSAGIQGITPAPTVRDSTACDILTLQDGSKIEARVSLVDQASITYKRCNNLDGPAYIVSKSSVFMIKYRNGSIEVFGKASNATPAAPKESRTNLNTTSNDKAKVDGLGVFALLVLPFVFIIPMPVIFGFILTLFSFIFGVTAPKRIYNSKGKLKWQGFGTVAAILSGIILVLLLIGLLIMA